MTVELTSRRGKSAIDSRFRHLADRSLFAANSASSSFMGRVYVSTAWGLSRDLEPARAYGVSDPLEQQISRGNPSFPLYEWGRPDSIPQASYFTGAKHDASYSLARATLEMIYPQAEADDKLHLVSSVQQVFRDLPAGSWALDIYALAVDVDRIDRKQLATDSLYGAFYNTDGREHALQPPAKADEQIYIS